MFLRRFFWFFSAICFAASRADAGAFLAPPGEGEIITSTSFSGSSRSFDAHGKLIPVPSYEKFELGTYIEYGATDFLTVVASPSVDHVHTGSPAAGNTHSEMGIGDSAIGARLGLYKTSNFVVSVQGLLRPPLTLQTDSLGRVFDHSHVWGGEIRGLLGTTMQIAGLPAFADVEAGYRWNDRITPDEWRADLTFGLHATREFMLLLQNFTAISDGRTYSNPSYYWDKGQITGVYAFNPQWSGQIGGFLTLAGRNAGREMGPIAAVWYRF